MIVPIKSNQTYNVFFIATFIDNCVATDKEVGAISLNYMIQDMAKYNRDDAFSLIADAIKYGVIKFNDDNKCLRVVDDVYTKWRDIFCDVVLDVNSSLRSGTWSLKAYRRSLTLGEQKLVEKYVSRGNLKEIVEKKSKKHDDIDWSNV